MNYSKDDCSVARMENTYLEDYLQTRTNRNGQLKSINTRLKILTEKLFGQEGLKGGEVNPTKTPETLQEKFEYQNTIEHDVLHSIVAHIEILEKFI